MEFRQLNHGWGAEPNAPSPRVDRHARLVRLRFILNGFIYAAGEEEEARLLFPLCSAWRLGSVDSDGWYEGRCRYGRAAPRWGEFYEITGVAAPQRAGDWHEIASAGRGDRHFLFYFRDATFECLAAGWRLKRRPAGI